jgi:hypothetical protein
MSMDLTATGCMTAFKFLHGAHNTHDGVNLKHPGLHMIMMHLANLNTRWRILLAEIACTHPMAAPQVPRVVGMALLRVFLFNWRVCREASLVNCVGMLPVSLLSLRYSHPREVRVDSSLGMVPEMALVLRSRYLPAAGEPDAGDRMP